MSKVQEKSDSCILQKVHLGLILKELLDFDIRG